MNKKIMSFVAAILCVSLTACQTVASSTPAVSTSPSSQPVSSEAATPTYARTVNAEVVVIGAGGAGMSAALEAVKNGAASVAIIEKLAFTGGSLNTTAGTMSGAETIIQELDGLKDSNQSYYDDVVAEGSKLGGKPNLELVKAYIDNNSETISWMWELGLKDRTFTTDKDGKKSVFAPEHTLYSFPRSYKAKPQDTKYKSAAHEIMDQQLAANSDKITVYYQTEAKHLLSGDKGQILGVETMDLKSNELVKFEAEKGVVVCTGGYSANPALMSHFNPITASVIAGGLPTANGYGMYMMQEVGGSLNEESMAWIPSFPGGRENPDAPGTGNIAPVYVAEAGGIFVNKDGLRYINENEQDNVKREVALDEQGYHYEIFTDAILTDLAAAKRDNMWKFLYAPVKDKFVLEAATLEELAAKMELPAEAFAKTVSDYNAAVDEGKTDSLGRNYFKDENPNNKFRNKIEGDKFYAVKMRPLAIVTVGGINTNVDMQVLDMTGNPIPGLFAAGECVQVWGSYISSGTGVMGAMTFGRLAGEAVMTKELGSGYVAAPAANLMDIKLFEKQKTGGAVKAFGVLKDGKYQSTVDGQEGPMTVEVTVTGGKVSAVDILSHNESVALAQPAIDALPAAIVAGNSLDVEAVSGATLTSNRIIKAVEQALVDAQ